MSQIDYETARSNLLVINNITQNLYENYPQVFGYTPSTTSCKRGEKRPEISKTKKNNGIDAFHHMLRYTIGDIAGYYCQTLANNHPEFKKNLCDLVEHRTPKNPLDAIQNKFSETKKSLTKLCPFDIDRVNSKIMLSAFLSKYGQVENAITPKDMSEELLGNNNTDSFAPSILGIIDESSSDMQTQTAKIIHFYTWDFLNKFNKNDVEKPTLKTPNLITSFAEIETYYEGIEKPQKPHLFSFRRKAAPPLSQCPLERIKKRLGL